MAGEREGGRRREKEVRRREIRSGEKEEGVIILVGEQSEPT